MNESAIEPASQRVPWLLSLSVRFSPLVKDVLPASSPSKVTCYPQQRHHSKPEEHGALGKPNTSKPVSQSVPRQT